MIRAAILCAALATPAGAEPDRVSVLLGSRHVGSGGFEEFNPGVFLTWEADRLDWSIGAYRNSYGGGSVAATVALPLARWDDGEFAVFAGAAWYPGFGRYAHIHAGDVVPIGGVQIRHGRAFFQIIPMDGDPVFAVVSGGVTFEMGHSPETQQGF